MNRALAAVFEVIGRLHYDEDIIWPNELYPYRVRIKLIKVIPPQERYSISQLDIREVLFRHHSSAYGITLVLIKRPLHDEAIEILLKYIEQSPNWDDFDPDHELELLENERSDEQKELPEEVVLARIDTPNSSEETYSAHTQMQYYIAKLGQSLGFQVWIPKPDQGKEFAGIALGELSVSELPRLPFSNDVLRIIQYIDVIWLQHQNPTHLFEIELTTSIYSGLLRMSDFTSLIPSLNIQMYICAKEEKLPKVRTEVNRPTFSRMLAPLVDRCRFVSLEQLEGFMETQHEYLRHFNTSILDELSESLYPIPTLV